MNIWKRVKKLETEAKQRNCKHRFRGVTIGRWGQEYEVFAYCKHCKKYLSCDVAENPIVNKLFDDLKELLETK